MYIASSVEFSKRRPLISMGISPSGMAMSIARLLTQIWTALWIRLPGAFQHLISRQSRISREWSILRPCRRMKISRLNGTHLLHLSNALKHSRGFNS